MKPCGTCKFYLNNPNFHHSEDTHKGYCYGATADSVAHADPSDTTHPCKTRDWFPDHEKKDRYQPMEIKDE